MVAQAAGEGQASGLRPDDRRADRAHDALRHAAPGRQPVPGSGARSRATLRFPAKAIRLAGRPADRRRRPPPAGRRPSWTVPRCGAGSAPASASRTRRGGFAEPNGLALVPAELAAELGFDIAGGRHRQPPAARRPVRPTAGSCTPSTWPAALAGIQTVTGPVPDGALALGRGLVAGDRSRWSIAAAGVHLLLGWHPRTGAVSILAGTTVEGLKDGPAARRLAGPAVRAGGATATGSGSPTPRPRRCATSTPPASCTPRSARACSTSATCDGPAEQARLQHPLGLAVLDDGSIAIADTYNGAIRRYDPATDEVGHAGHRAGRAVRAGAGRRRAGGGRVGRAPAGPAGHRRAAATRCSATALRTARPVTELAAGHGAS